MTAFKITYRDPETITADSEGKLKSVVHDFSDTVIPGEMAISALEWAEDWAYTVADKGWYTIEEVE